MEHESWLAKIGLAEAQDHEEICQDELESITYTNKKFLNILKGLTYFTICVIVGLIAFGFITLNV
jgi:hypothetical protein